MGSFDALPLSYTPTKTGAAGFEPTTFRSGAEVSHDAVLLPAGASTPICTELSRVQAERVAIYALEALELLG